MILYLDTNSLTTRYLLFNTLLTSIHIVLGSYHMASVVPLPSPCTLLDLLTSLYHVGYIVFNCLFNSILFLEAVNTCK